MISLDRRFQFACQRPDLEATIESSKSGFDPSGVVMGTKTLKNSASMVQQLPCRCHVPCALAQGRSREHCPAEVVSSFHQVENADGRLDVSLSSRGRRWSETFRH